MSHYTPEALATSLRSGLLSFPVTHFTDDLHFDEARYREHLSWLSGFDVAGLFAAGGTGEGFSLTPEETEQVVRAAVSEVNGRVPVIAPATGATSTAVDLAQRAESAGADGLLVLPPYLTEASQQGLADRIRQIAAATDLPLIVYSRANGQLTAETVATLADELPSLIGFKDGVGNIEAIARTYARVGERLVYIGGLPTAETFALPYLELGATTYSSAIFNFVPEFALNVYQNVVARNREEVYRQLNEFVIPFTQIRDTVPGYAVSLIKAGLDVVGRNGGPVRSPLTRVTGEAFDQLHELVARVTTAAAAR